MMKATRMIKHFDVYGRTLGFRYEGHDKVRSVMGAVTSILVFVLIVAITGHRLIMWSNEANFIGKEVIEGYFEGKGSMTDSDDYAPNGLMIGEHREVLDDFYMGVGFINQ